MDHENLRSSEVDRYLDSDFDVEDIIVQPTRACKVCTSHNKRSETAWMCDRCQGRYYLSSDLQSSDITAKLQLLTLHFPRLRLVWSPSPYATAQLFHELKEGKDEPVASVAAAVGLEGTTLEDDVHIEKYNTAIHDFVSKLPGVNTKNLVSLMNKGESLDHLMTLSKEQLGDLISNSQNGVLLHDALHKPLKAPTEATSFRGRARGRGFRRRKT
ncbi:DNA repair endonuclease XPF [Homalodisca vitripennis]|nr:DNA repair endonuclease XPF [Homalodisca vitripennis]